MASQQNGLPDVEARRARTRPRDALILPMDDNSGFVLQLAWLLA